jgi:hypothetical protein
VFESYAVRWVLASVLQASEEEGEERKRKQETTVNIANVNCFCTPRNYHSKKESYLFPFTWV